MQKEKTTSLVFEEKGKFKVWYDEEQKMICGKYWGSMDEKQAMQIAEAFMMIGEQMKAPVSVFNDMTDAGSADLKARRYFIYLMQYKKLSKIAFWGGSQLNQAFISFILEIAGVNKVRYFISKEEALFWLKK